jgi:16S rRNA processing protein RimM
MVPIVSGWDGPEPLAPIEPEPRAASEPGVEVVVGVIGRAHGVHGEVVVDVRTDEPERRFAAGQVLRAESTTRSFRVVSSRLHGTRRLIRFAELSDRTSAEQVRGLRLVIDVDPAELPSGPEEYFDRQLVGLTVRSADDPHLGRVVSVLHLPHQDLLEISVADGSRQLVPFVSALVPEIDLIQRTILLANVPGLLGDDPAV